MRKNKDESATAVIISLVLATLVILICWSAYESSLCESKKREKKPIVFTPKETLKPIQTPTQKVKKKSTFNGIKECTWTETEQKLVSSICKKYSISFELAVAQAKQESRWNVNASGDGGKAYGAWQIHPCVWSDELERWGMTWDDMYDLEKSCIAYCKIMKSHFKKNDDVYFALMAWRWGGQDAINKLNNNGPDAYARKISSWSQKYERRNEE